MYSANDLFSNMVGYEISLLALFSNIDTHNFSKKVWVLILIKVQFKLSTVKQGQTLSENEEQKENLIVFCKVLWVLRIQ